MIRYIKILVLFGVLSILSGCKLDEDPIVSVVTVKTYNGVTKLEGCVKLQAEIIQSAESSDNYAYISNKGFCYSVNQNPTINDFILLNKDQISSNPFLMEGVLTDLKKNTMYYARAFVQNNSGVIYGNEISFYTADLTYDGEVDSEDDFSDEFEYVDLGLSVKWATKNLGATSPEDFGGYFAWGEIGIKNYYNWYNYKWGNGEAKKLTKYCSNVNYGSLDYKKQLDKSDDAAYVKLGGNWRIPSVSELEELRTKCEWQWTYKNGVAGYRVKSKTTGSSIFLPAAGGCVESDIEDVGLYGYYWGSNIFNEENNTCTYAITMDFSSDEIYSDSGYLRFYGFSIRPVYDN